jgi:hypothetical protein
MKNRSFTIWQQFCQSASKPCIVKRIAANFKRLSAPTGQDSLETLIGQTNEIGFSVIQLPGIYCRWPFSSHTYSKSS